MDLFEINNNYNEYQEITPTHVLNKIKYQEPYFISENICLATPVYCNDTTLSEIDHKNIISKNKYSWWCCMAGI